jgi:two-component system, chemotaxis family, response regulator Rcp1
MNASGRRKLIEILLVEDNKADSDLAREVLREADVRSNLSVARDGEEAIAFLRRKNGHTDRPRPDLVLLDLNLPRKDGRELLAEMKADPDLRRIPVIVLTASAADRDVAQAYEHHVNAYITKPTDFDSFVHAVKLIEAFWLGVVRLPPQG